MKLEGKRVLITGGSSGIGLAIARALLAKGARIAISGRRAAFVSAAVDELGKAGGSVTGIAADVGTVEAGHSPCDKRSTHSVALTFWSTMRAEFAPAGSRPHRRARSRRSRIWQRILGSFPGSGSSRIWTIS
jgi:NAD(P)-dependent dehydrogenase (short-subunit alcohol dehydrogenase family)